MEEFFKDSRLRDLFLYFSDDIKAQGHTIKEGRSKKGPISKDKEVEIMSQFRKEVDSLVSIAEMFTNLPNQEDKNTKINLASQGIKKTVKETKNHSK